MTLIIGHRGAPCSAGENTVESVIRGVELGLTVIEIDLQVTADNYLVIHHDLELEGRWLADLTYAEIKQYKPQVPTIQTLLERCPLVDLLVDIKVHCHYRERLEYCLLKWLTSVIDQGQWVPYLKLISFDHTLVEYLKQIFPQLNYGLLWATQVNWLALDQSLVEGVRYVVYQANFVDHRLVERCHRQGLVIYVFTVNQMKEYARLRGLGVDGIITDCPETFLSHLGIDISD